MSFRNRLLLGMALIMAAFITAIAVAYGGLRTTSSRFGNFLDGVGALHQDYREMYAQGLQMGQALRNIVLDPENPKAFSNLDKARQDFATAQDNAARLAAGIEGFGETTKQLAALAATQAEAQTAVMAALKAGQIDTARQLINSRETPAWRALKKALLDDATQLEQMTRTEREAVSGQVDRLQSIMLALSMLAVLVGIGSVITTLVYVRRELGGEPAYARDVANRVATGDLSQAITLHSGDQRSLLAALDSMQKQLRELVSSLAKHARDVDEATQQMTSATSLVAEGSHRQLAYSREMAANVQALGESRRSVMAAVDEAQHIVQDSTQVSGGGATLAGKAAGEAEAMADAIKMTARVGPDQFDPRCDFGYRQSDEFAGA